MFRKPSQGALYRVALCFIWLNKPLVLRKSSMCRINRGPPLKDIRTEWYHSQALKFGGKSPGIYEVAIDSCTGT
ncbi:hypothetical protein AD953_09165 [Acetobacter malorum]|uniref:Uncharacterized protein n=1 Tax=Acetobacter malorum TaxID=178901 RepID=A0A149V526_9PROT|nr:hypothetical protein AD953_09165 [Acetobacter malorum]